MFRSINRASFHLWRKEKLLKHQRVSKYYENDCSHSSIPCTLVQKCVADCCDVTYNPGTQKQKVWSVDLVLVRDNGLAMDDIIFHF